MTSFDYDLFVIGAGSGGIRASRISHHLGAKVAIAENYRIGGTCVIRGCIPKKLLSYAAHYAEDLEDARGFGWSIEGASFSWPALIANKNREIARLSAMYTDGFAKIGVSFLLHSTVSGIARRAGGTLEAAVSGLPGGKFECDAVMYATGRKPNTARLGLTELGVKLDEEGGVVVDRYCRSSVANIFAVGDVTNRLALTPVAIREGAAVAMTLYGRVGTPVDLHYVPSGAL